MDNKFEISYDRLLINYLELENYNKADEIRKLVNFPIKKMINYFDQGTLQKYQEEFNKIDKYLKGKTKVGLYLIS